MKGSSHSIFVSTATAFVSKKSACNRYSEEDSQCFQHGMTIMKYRLRTLQKEKQKLLCECYEW